MRKFFLTFLLLLSCNDGGIVLPIDEIFNKDVFMDIFDEEKELLFFEKEEFEKIEEDVIEEDLEELLFEEKIISEISEIFKEEMQKKEIEIIEECDLFAQNCPPDEGCYLLGFYTKCVPQMPAAKTQDEPCGVINECKGGYYCHLYAEGVAKCEKFCIIDAKDEKYGCKEGYNCTTLIVFPDWLGVCAKPYKKCNPLTGDCIEGEGCYLQEGGETKCVPTSKNPKNEGEDCKWANECKPGLWCISVKKGEFKCMQYCDLKNNSIKCLDNKKCTKISNFPEGIGLCI